MCEYQCYICNHKLSDHDLKCKFDDGRRRRLQIKPCCGNTTGTPQLRVRLPAFVDDFGKAIVLSCCKICHFICKICNKICKIICWVWAYTIFVCRICKTICKTCKTNMWNMRFHMHNYIYIYIHISSYAILCIILTYSVSIWRICRTICKIIVL
jgi:hypothetical protein